MIILCLLAALTFWLLNAMNDSYTTTVSYPVEFIFDTDRYVPVEPLPEEIQINVSGLGWNLLRNNLGIKVTPVLFNLESPTDIKRISASSMIGTVTDQIDEVQVNFILTDTLYLDIDRLVESKFKLVIDSAALDIAQSHWISSEVLHTPDSVTLIGPELLLESYGDSINVRVDEEEIAENFNEDITIDVTRGHLVTRIPPTVRVTFSVEEFERSNTRVRMTLEDFPEDSSAYLIDHYTNVSYNVAIDDAPLIKSDSFWVAINFKNINPEDSTIAPEILKYPDIIKEVELDTTRFKVIYND